MGAPVVAVNKSILLAKRIFSLPNDFLCILGGEGAWHLCHPTEAVIEYFLGTRKPSEAAKIRDQLAQPFLQRTYNQGRISPIYHYMLDPDSLHEGEEYRDSLFQVEMQVDGKKQRSHVTFFQGRLFSVELPKPLKFYKGKSIVFGDVKPGKTSQSITRAINRLEHGRDDDI